MRIIAGKIQELPVFDRNKLGLILGDEKDQVLLPSGGINRDVADDELVKVFVYYNQTLDLEATTQLPEIEINEVGTFRVKNANDIGAFIDVGTTRDILIPIREQREQLVTGSFVLIILKEDVQNRRLFASTKLTSYIRNPVVDFKRGDEVDLIVAEKMDLGRRVVINGKFMGVLFRQEMTGGVKLGDKVKGYVRKVEGKDITVSMQKEGLELLDEAVKQLLEFLENNGGYARLSDNSTPEEIKLRLRMSKGTFKKAAGVLFKQQKVELTKFGIKLINQPVVEVSKKKVYTHPDKPWLK
ncbi:MAG: S1-like domain-containing RNA-binding protein [Flavobacteriales bacterium]|nr:S1-like domain-containing RNA-binding protein [Flavobacteriales bacterium]